MKNQDILFLFDYNYWTRDRILEQTARLSGEEFLEPRDYGHGSIRSELVHILSAEWVWRLRCQEKISPTSLLQVNDFPSVQALRTRWQQEEEMMRGYMLTLTEAELEGQVTYRRTGGEARTNVLWHLLVHVVNHGTEHRSQVAEALTAFGYSPGDLDVIHYLRAIGA